MVAEQIASSRRNGNLSFVAELVACATKRRQLMPQVRWLVLIDYIESIDLVGGIVTFVNACLILRLAVYRDLLTNSSDAAAIGGRHLIWLVP